MTLPPIPGELKIPRGLEDVTLAGRKAVMERPVDIPAAVVANQQRSVVSTVKLAKAMPMAARVLGERVENPKIWAFDIKPIKSVDPSDWLSRVYEQTKQRATGDVLTSTLDRCAQRIVHGVRIGQGAARHTFASLANGIGCCVETARKCVRWLEERELIDTFNVLGRHNGELQREANMYLLRPAPAAAPKATPESGSETAEQTAGQTSVLQRINDRLQRWAAAFGLQVRPWGLNATPVATRNLQPVET